jgi:hypothetical protein
MTSPKLLLALMAAAAYAAPQINERQVVGQVLTQLTPAIQQAISSIGIGSSRSVSVPSSRFSGATGFTSSSSGLGSSRSSGLSSSRFSGAGSSRFSGATGGSSFSSGSRSSGASVSGITSSVVSQLQPSIAAAVAQALAGSRRSSSVSLGGANREEEYADGPAQYNFEYKVADDEAQNYIARQESRDGDTVTGSYNYVNPAGTLVTVNYEAGPEGFKQETSEQKGAVEMRNVPVGWDGPLAGVDDAGVSSGVSASRQSSSLSQSDLIAKILATLQPRITSAVQSAVGQTSTVRVAPRPVAVAPRPVTYAARRPVSSFTRSSSGSADQSSIVSSVISSLSPRISSAVSSALAGSNRRSSVSSRGSQASNSGLSGLFGVSGQSSVSLETPEFAVQY